jgi:hypothetical protein
MICMLCQSLGGPLYTIVNAYLHNSNYILYIYTLGTLERILTSYMLENCLSWMHTTSALHPDISRFWNPHLMCDPSSTAPPSPRGPSNDPKWSKATCFETSWSYRRYLSLRKLAYPLSVRTKSSDIINRRVTSCQWVFVNSGSKQKKHIVRLEAGGGWRKLAG